MTLRRMSTLMRTSNLASKLIAGHYSAGNPTNEIPSSSALKLVTINDLSANFITAKTLQAYVQRQVNRLTAIPTFSSSKGITVTSRRFLHNDVTFPNFDKYRHEMTLDPTKPAIETSDDRKSHMAAVFYGVGIRLVGGMLSMIVVREIAQTLVYYKAMAADQKALSSIEINLNEIPEGNTKTYEWRGKPVFVRHRTNAEIRKEREVNIAELRHPETDEQRVKQDKWSVVIGVCTHLGCVPIPSSGEYNGYYCPCHGSHYDVAGRIRKGPAPLNLNIPEYTFTNDTTIVVGSS